MRNIIRTTAPALLILLFAYAAFSKIADTSAFRQQMHNQNFSAGFADALVVLVPGAELLVIALLLSGRHQMAGLALSALLMTAFSGYIALVLAGYWTRIPCSCGGVLKNMSWQVHFFFNLFFLAVALAALYDRYKQAPKAI